MKTYLVAAVMALAGNIQLPGTTGEARKGTPNPARELGRLQLTLRVANAGYPRFGHPSTVMDGWLRVFQIAKAAHRQGNRQLRTVEPVGRAPRGPRGHREAPGLFDRARPAGQARGAAVAPQHPPVHEFRAVCTYGGSRFRRPGRHPPMNRRQLEYNHRRTEIRSWGGPCACLLFSHGRLLGLI
jgi:hypothetical protein